MAVLQLNSHSCLVKTSEEPPYLLYHDGVSTGELYTFSEIGDLKKRSLN
jgi:hypothetical protein